MKTVRTALTAVALAVALTACQASTTTTEGGVNLVSEGKLSVCTQLPYKPFEFRQGDDVVGFDVEMMDLVAEKLGLTTEIVNTPFEGIQSGQSLNTNKCDVAAAAMTITDERAQVVDFSDPYFDATQALLVKKGADIASMEDLAGKTLGVQQGTTGQIYAEDNAPENTQLRVYEDLGLLTTAVKTGQVDAGIQDNVALMQYVQDNPDTEISTQFDTGEAYGFAVKKGGNDELLTTINDVIATSKEDGTYDKIYEKWFGGQPGGAS